MISKRHFIAAVLASAFPLAMAQAQAQADYPNKIIRIVVPFGPGALTGTFAQLLAEGLKQRMGQAVIVEYKPGATGNIGADSVAKSPPDGYSLVVTVNATFAINPSVYTKMPFDPLRDFEHVGTGVAYGTILVVPPDSPFRSVADIVVYAKANPGKLTQASSGTGSTAHLAGELFARRAGFKMLHIPYKSGPAARMDVMGGRVSLMFTDPSAVPLIKDGKLRALAVSNSKRSAAMPDVPTLAEQGYPDFNVETWFGIAAPAGTPKALVAKLQAEMTNVLNRADVREKLLALGAEVPDTSTAAVVRRITDEQKMWAPIIKDLGITVE